MKNPKTPKAHITPSVLRWGRESAGYTAEEVAAKLKRKTITADTIADWESGKSLPSYPQFVAMSKIYRRATALFFAPEPPQGEELEKKFRTLPAEYVKKIPTAVRFTVREARARQWNLEELHETPPVPNLSGLVDAKIPLAQQDTAKIARAVRKRLQVGIDEQKKWRNADDALKQWRAKVESLGVWVFKSSFGRNGEGEDYDGFCLPDKHFPVIYLNNGKPQPRQIFTLFHELGHLLLSRGGICFRNDMEGELRDEAKEEEVFCNAFAGECLVPDGDFSIDGGTVLKDIGYYAEHYADIYRVSREVILRKFKDRGLITWSKYNEVAEQWRVDFANLPKIQGSGGNYYATQGAYHGTKFLELVFSRYYQRQISKYELADYLGATLDTLPGLESIIYK